MTGHFLLTFLSNAGTEVTNHTFILSFWPHQSVILLIFFFFCYLFHYGMTTRFHNCTWAESNPFMPTDARWSAATWPSHLLVPKAAVRRGKVVLNVLWCCGGERWQTGLGAAPQPSLLCVPSSDKLNPTRLLEHGPTRYRLLGQLDRCRDLSGSKIYVLVLGLMERNTGQRRKYDVIDI